MYSLLVNLTLLYFFYKKFGFPQKNINYKIVKLLLFSRHFCRFSRIHDKNLGDKLEVLGPPVHFPVDAPAGSCWSRLPEEGPAMKSRSCVDRKMIRALLVTTVTFFLNY